MFAEEAIPNKFRHRRRWTGRCFNCIPSPGRDPDCTATLVAWDPFTVFVSPLIHHRAFSLPCSRSPHKGRSRLFTECVTMWCPVPRQQRCGRHSAFPTHACGSSRLAARNCHWRAPCPALSNRKSSWHWRSMPAGQGDSECCGPLAYDPDALVWSP